MPKRKAHISDQKKTPLLSNMLKGLDINRFLDVCKYGDTNFFKKVVEGMKKGQTNLPLVENFEKNPVLIQRSKMTRDSRSAFPYFNVIHNMFGAR